MESKVVIFRINDKESLTRLEELKESLNIKTNSGVLRRLLKYGKL